jgi:NCAIR mutase (PurE)-related protein
LDDRKIGQLKRYRLGLKLYPIAQAATWTAKPIRATGNGTILVVSAGTSDIPVAEEAALTATMMGNKVERLFDVGVAGMEGALPSVVAGLVAKPVIAVPTSIGYGASFHGLSALLGMLNSCAAGVTVVNIDNGFGAGFAASLINRV